MLEAKLNQVISHAEPLSVEVTRGQRGGYGWTIKFYGHDSYGVCKVVHNVDIKLKELFLVQAGEELGESKEHTD